MADDFDWNDTDLKLRRGHGDVAIYANANGDIVFRQRDNGFEDDAIVVLPRHLGSWAIAAIEAELKMVSDDLASSRPANQQQK